MSSLGCASYFPLRFCSSRVPQLQGSQSCSIAGGAFACLATEVGRGRQQGIAAHAFFDAVTRSKHHSSEEWGLSLNFDSWCIQCWIVHCQYAISAWVLFVADESSLKRPLPALEVASSCFPAHLPRETLKCEALCDLQTCCACKWCGGDSCWWPIGMYVATERNRPPFWGYHAMLFTSPICFVLSPAGLDWNSNTSDKAQGSLNHVRACDK